VRKTLPAFADLDHFRDVMKMISGIHSSGFAVAAVARIDYP
jgi:hypothetical protein